MTTLRRFLAATALACAPAAAVAFRCESSCAAVSTPEHRYHYEADGADKVVHGAVVPAATTCAGAEQQKCASQCAPVSGAKGCSAKRPTTSFLATRLREGHKAALSTEQGQGTRTCPQQRPCDCWCKCPEIIFGSAPPPGIPPPPAYNPLNPPPMPPAPPAVPFGGSELIRIKKLLLQITAVKNFTQPK